MVARCTARRSGPPRGQARIEDDIVADRKLEHVEAQLAGEVEDAEVGVRPAAGEEIAVGAVFHGGKIPQPGGQFKPAGQSAMMKA